MPFGWAPFLLPFFPFCVIIGQLIAMNPDSLPWLFPTSTATSDGTVTVTVTGETPTAVPLTLEVTVPVTETPTITLTIPSTPTYAKISANEGGGGNGGLGSGGYILLEAPEIVWGENARLNLSGGDASDTNPGILVVIGRETGPSIPDRTTLVGYLCDPVEYATADP